MPRDSVVFDINETVLDLSALKPVFKETFADDSALLLWFSQLLHASTVCIASGVSTKFSTLAAAQLDAIAVRYGSPLSEVQRREILNRFAHLPAHVDIKPALLRLRDNGFRTVAFSNSSLDLISRQMQNSGLLEYFDDVISVEETGSFKPDPKVYRFAAEKLGEKVPNLRLVATHDWDTHGALSAGLKAAYIDRSGIPYHPLYRRPDIQENTMGAIVDQILARSRD